MNFLKDCRAFLTLWLTQTLSSLGSAMTSFALVIWLYQDSGSALMTSLLTVCSYAPYVLMSIFAGVVSDKWNKKTVMLVCDSFAAVCTVVTLVLLRSGSLAVWHLYLLNALVGLMNAVQSPAAEVTATHLTPEVHYQKTGSLRYFSNSLVSILTPVLAAAFVSFAGIEAVIAFDLCTFAAAFLVLLCVIRIPDVPKQTVRAETIWQSAKSGLSYVRSERGLLLLILFLSAINFIASINKAALPAMILSRESETVLGVVNSFVGIATLLGSVLAAFLPKPRSRIRVVCLCLFFSMSTENFLLAVGHHPLLWCIGVVLGWILIPVMGANYDVILRSRVPHEMQGRVYAVRNTLQFFTIPLGYFCGGWLVDEICEPLMAAVDNPLLTMLFGSGKGAGAAFLFFVIGIIGTVVCLVFGGSKELRKLP